EAGRAAVFAITSAPERAAVFWPAGRWIGYEEWQFTRSSVVGRPFPGPGPKQQVSIGEGGMHPIWIGREIFYQSQGAIFALDVKSGPGLVLGKPQRLFQADFGSEAFDVTPDGRGFLAIRQKREPRFVPFNVFSGWW